MKDFNKINTYLKNNFSNVFLRFSPKNDILKKTPLYIASLSKPNVGLLYYVSMGELLSVYFNIYLLFSTFLN